MLNPLGFDNRVEPFFQAHQSSLTILKTVIVTLEPYKLIFILIGDLDEMTLRFQLQLIPCLQGCDKVLLDDFLKVFQVIISKEF